MQPTPLQQQATQHLQAGKVFVSHGCFSKYKPHTTYVGSLLLTHLERNESRSISGLSVPQEKSDLISCTSSLQRLAGRVLIPFSELYQQSILRASKKNKKKKRKQNKNQQNTKPKANQMGWNQSGRVNLFHSGFDQYKRVFLALTWKMIQHHLVSFLEKYSWREEPDRSTGIRFGAWFAKWVKAPKHLSCDSFSLLLFQSNFTCIL